MKFKNLLTIFLISFSLMALELIWTRIFSAEFFYTFAFLILSLAVLGLGLGALALRFFPWFIKKDMLGVVLLITGLLILVSPPLVFLLKLDFTLLAGSWLMFGKIVLAVLLLSSAYFCGGIALAILFRKNHQEMPRMYMADLIGAGLGVISALVLMNLFGTPLATVLVVVPVLLAAFIAGAWKLRIVVVALLFVIPCQYHENWLAAERQERAPVIYTHWDAMSKIKIYDYGEEYRGINIDNTANSPVYRFDGNWERPDSLHFQFGIPVKNLIQRFDACTFLSLGAGGGADVLQALQEGAAEIHAVEVNPHINHLMTDGELAEFSGNIYRDPRVKVVTEDARAYVRRFENKFDLIYSLSSNTFAALASGAFALAENYLFTTEAFEDYWNALSDSGFMMMEHQFYMPRLVSQTMIALKNCGVENVTSHFAVYDLPQLRRNMILLSKRPLTDEIRCNAFLELSPENYGYIHLLYPAADSLQGNLINQIVQNGWQTVTDSAKIDISSCDDNRPFVAQLGLWRNFKPEKLKKITPYEFSGFPLSKLILIAIIAVVLILIIPLNLLPYLTKGAKLKPAPWFYFFAIGMGFMSVEIILIQKYTLFIGPSIYSLLAVLLTLLVFSGIGSYFSPKVKSLVAFGGIILWLLLDIFIFKYLIYALDGLTLLPRFLITVLLIAPLGFFMGMPFPKGSRKVGELVDWGFAVNGAASVLASTLIVLIAFTFGFSIALTFGIFFYLIAFALINKKSAW